MAACCRQYNYSFFYLFLSFLCLKPACKLKRTADDPKTDAVVAGGGRAVVAVGNAATRRTAAPVATTKHAVRTRQRPQGVFHRST
jgi:hypothetical protein